jgi:hypothetical protein
VVGKEGAIGVALFMEGETTPSRAIVQSSGFAYRLEGKRLMQEFTRHGEMLRLLLFYTQALITVLDRPKLEQLSCECYAVVKRETDRLLPRPKD